MKKLFLMWGFLFSPLSLLKNEIENKCKIFNKVENGIASSTYPTLLPSLILASQKWFTFLLQKRGRSTDFFFVLFV